MQPVPSLLLIETYAFKQRFAVSINLLTCSLFGGLKPEKSEIYFLFAATKICFQVACTYAQFFISK